MLSLQLHKDLIEIKLIPINLRTKPREFPLPALTLISLRINLLIPMGNKTVAVAFILDLLLAEVRVALVGGADLVVGGDLRGRGLLVAGGAHEVLGADERIAEELG